MAVNSGKLRKKSQQVLKNGQALSITSGWMRKCLIVKARESQGP